MYGVVGSAAANKERASSKLGVGIGVCGGNSILIFYRIILNSFLTYIVITDQNIFQNHF